ncbi:4-amino-4-deoxy-L-arabinose transferase-like glycosyltransferase [Nonomuraea thailandensis]|uniref:4-amino-4-deoxy-L-arabinose transferase-like glycosyltransferase n=1 Tax=Nonomuraea thailandensis TaxID=1188745 RepID=A0A9X2K3P9_9ACTN|nr:hypothetical protein [Nonomuraea thailandensis]MCP2359692.1 4-amino-4-deoxy-L-arabinose transferase-like glycosyltransferase [Nonomuraea thailandensis]
MDNLLVGLGASTALLLAVGIVLIWKKVAPKFTAWWMLAAGFGLIGTFFETIVRTATGRLHPIVPAVALGICGTIWVADVWGKSNKVGRATALVAALIPTLLVVSAISIFGVNTADLGRDVKKAWQETVTADVKEGQK